jgi:hypothetical protein
MEVGALSGLFGGLFMVLTEFYGLEILMEPRILQRGRMRSEKVVAWKESLNACALCDARCFHFLLS